MSKSMQEEPSPSAPVMVWVTLGRGTTSCHELGRRGCRLGAHATRSICAWGRVELRQQTRGDWRGALVLGPVDRVVPGVTQVTRWLQDNGPVLGNTVRSSNVAWRESRRRALRGSFWLLVRTVQLGLP